jgi:hypothetical protein
MSLARVRLPVVASCVASLTLGAGVPEETTTQGRIDLNELVELKGLTLHVRSAAATNAESGTVRPDGTFSVRLYHDTPEPVLVLDEWEHPRGIAFSAASVRVSVESTALYFVVDEVRLSYELPKLDVAPALKRIEKLGCLTAVIKGTRNLMKVEQNVERPLGPLVDAVEACGRAYVKKFEPRAYAATKVRPLPAFDERVSPVFGRPPEDQTGGIAGVSARTTRTRARHDAGTP